MATQNNKKKPKSSASKMDEVPFEKNLEELEILVKKLEKGDLPLEESLGVFERGLNIFKHCHQKLQTAEKKVEILLSESLENQPELEAFEPEN